MLSEKEVSKERRSVLCGYVYITPLTCDLYVCWIVFYVHTINVFGKNNECDVCVCVLSGCVYVQLHTSSSDYHQ